MGTDECASTESNSKYKCEQLRLHQHVVHAQLYLYLHVYKAIEYANVCIKNLPAMSVSEGEQTQTERLAGRGVCHPRLCLLVHRALLRRRALHRRAHQRPDYVLSSRVSRDIIYDNCVADLQRAVELQAAVVR